MLLLYVYFNITRAITMMKLFSRQYLFFVNCFSLLTICAVKNTHVIFILQHRLMLLCRKDIFFFFDFRRQERHYCFLNSTMRTILFHLRFNIVEYIRTNKIIYRSLYRILFIVFGYYHLKIKRFTKKC